MQIGAYEYINTEINAEIVAKMIKSARKTNKSVIQSTYPLELINDRHPIFIKYDILYAANLYGKQLYKVKNSLNYSYNESHMLVIICHGYRSSASDMHLIKMNVIKALPTARILVSRANEVYTEGSLQKMGERLAEEVKLYLKTNQISESDVIINFVGHSMGGIIARASFKFLQFL